MVLFLSFALALAAVAAVALAVVRRPARGVRVGIDVVEVAGVRSALASSRAHRYLELVYTEAEQRDCERDSGGHDPSRLAARFAAKEAVWKALGDPPATRPWRSVEVVRDADGRPHVRLHAEALDAARRRRVRDVQVSLTHEPDYAAAMVVASR
jgi:holo-[acyl-carrier protein] synthase